MNVSSVTGRHLRATCLALGLALLGQAASALPPGDSGSPWGAGWFPNVPLTTHEGEPVRFFDDLVEGKVVVINFIYTTCPDSCPLETVRLKQVRDLLGDRVGEDVFFYSITIDPEIDTPEVLADYAETYRTGPGWTFLTGDEADITELRKKLGLYIADIQDGSKDHNLSMVIGNQTTGIWKPASPFEDPHVLAQQIGDWLHNYKHAPIVERDFADAPELRDLTKGESLFRVRCAACHTVGGGDILESVGDAGLPDGLPAGTQKVGPDLFGVTNRRDHDWLMSWLLDPQAMLEQQDPVIMGLYEAYNRVPMPDMQLNEREAGLLLEFLADESLRVLGERPELAARFSGAEEPDAPESCCEKRSALVLGDDEPDAGAPQLADASASGGGVWRRLAGLPLLSQVSIAAGFLLAGVCLVARRRRVAPS